jgi:hypothetical protein
MFFLLNLIMNSIKHEAESDGKTTALHARVLANEDVRVYSWKQMPQYENPERVLMLFPGPVSSNELTTR